MKVKVLHTFKKKNAGPAERGDVIDIAIRQARELIELGYVEAFNEEEKQVISYSKDNPPPEKQEVEIPKEIIQQQPAAQAPKEPSENNEGRHTVWQKIKSLWPRQA